MKCKWSILLGACFLPVISYAVLPQTTAAHWCLVDASGQVPSGCTSAPLTANHINDYTAAYQNVPVLTTDGWNGEKRIVPVFGSSTTETPVNMMPLTIAQALNYDYQKPVLTNWYDISKMTFFGGAEGDGQVLLPPPGLIMAAHQNGAKVYGTLFFSPNSFGGKKESAQLKSLLTPNAQGQYPEANLLIEVAKTYHIDGFFFNQEAGYPKGESGPENIPAFISYLQQESIAMGYPIKMEWYLESNDRNGNDFISSMMNKGKEVSGSIFANYGLCPGDPTITQAVSEGYPAPEVEAGVDDPTPEQPELSGFDGTSYSVGEFNFQGILDGTQVSTDLSTEYANEQTFWGYASQWFNNSNHFVVQNELSTTFSTGAGNQFYMNGTSTHYGYWRDMGLQAILPVAINTQAFQDQANYSEAYMGGNTFQIITSPQTSIQNQPFFPSLNIPVTPNTTLSMVYQLETSHTAFVSLCVNKDAVCIPLNGKGGVIVHGWIHQNVSMGTLLSKAGVKTITSLSIQVPAQSGIQGAVTPIEVNWGAIYVGAPASVVLPNPVVTVNTQVDPNNATYYHHVVSWKVQSGAYAYALYSGSTFIGMTRTLQFDWINQVKAAGSVTVKALTPEWT